MTRMTNQNRAKRTVGEAVRDAMTVKGISQYQLAAHLQLSQPAIWRRLTGAVEFSVGQITLAASLLEVTTDELMRPEDTPALAEEKAS